MTSLQPFVIVCPCGVASRDPIFMSQHLGSQHPGQVLGFLMIPVHAVQQVVRNIMEAANDARFTA